jgi:hypothetical protein
MLTANEGHFLVVSSATAFVGTPKMVDYSHRPHPRMSSRSRPMTPLDRTLNLVMFQLLKSSTLYFPFLIMSFSNNPFLHLNV